MPIVRQLPSLSTLRGSLANVTMANLTEDQQTVIEDVVQKVSNHPGMNKHKRSMVKALASTIGADYHDDRAAAEEEYLIAIWRAAVNLLYHTKYSFRCKSCNESSYITKSSKPKQFDRQYPVCPACNCVEVKTNGDTSYQQGQFVEFKEFQSSYEHFSDLQKSPTSKSPILSISGAKQHNNSQDILSDPKQLVKFFSEFAWNYFKQHIKENKIQIKKKEVQISGPADEVITKDIISLCDKLKADYFYCKETQNKIGVTVINCNTNLTTPEFTLKLAEILAKAKKHQIEVKIKKSTIEVLHNNSAPFIKSTIKTSEHVLIMESQDSHNDDQTGTTISQISYRTVGANAMHQEDHTQTIDAIDVMEVIRKSLPDGDCKNVFDIYSSQGETYLQFSNKYGDRKPAINHISDHLNITTRTVKQHIDIIKINMLAHGLHGVQEGQ
ncbi:hypothetical protein N9045_01910 [bacterium]|nr:hypothetical protein [bacterium]